MQEITGALIGIGLVLTAVFLPMAFFGGSTGVDLPAVLGHHRLGHDAVDPGGADPDAGAVRHPAQAGGRRRPQPSTAASSAGSTATSTRFRDWYHKRTAWFLQHTLDDDGRLRWRSWPLMAFLFMRLPTGFLPDEDQGFIFTLITLPAGATQRTHPGRGARSGRTLSREREGQCRLRLRRRRLQLRRLGPECRHGLHPSEGLGASARARRTAPRPSRSRAIDALHAACRDAQVFALVPPCGAGAGQCHRLRHPDAGPRQCRP